MAKKQSARPKRYTVIAQNLTLNKEQWRGQFNELSDAYDASYRLATSKEWSQASTNAKIDFIVLDNHFCCEVDRYHNQ